MAAAAGLRRAGGRFLLARDISSSSGGGANGHILGRRGFSGGGVTGTITMSRALLEDPGAPAPAPAPAMMDASATTTATRRGTPPSGSSAAASRITPAVLFVTVVLAVVLLVSGLLHVLRRLFLKSHHGSAGAGERQLQHLFFPAAHEEAGGSGSGGGGLGQAAIDALPAFAYGELSGLAAAAAASSRKGKEKAARPFDCAVCLCEFADDDRLRLLPLCGHAFHVACIDVWLRSTATCPLCRTKLSARHLAAAAGATDAPSSSVGTDVEEQKPQQDQTAPDADEAASSSVVLPVRLGRFENADAGDDDESSSGTSATSRIDRRRCYSMGSYQYVLADEHLLVSVHLRHGNAGAGVAAASSGEEQRQAGKKAFARGDSFSVSKIWQWRGSKRLPGGGICADDGLPWAPAAAKDDHASANTSRQHGDT